ncbi:CsgG/HfaB family protein [Alteromonas lipolytica]|uniref:Uncharacterized protein n=1 Tax=Alteromonas lipolytica TaxID=1856405 RepID=A0A1E8FJI0_9ALTE|nr:CsgG/HfaB family protein [Alteromonas lipolytica]OFI36082.1 hypothetical protein BFC17_10480 [Alteromonas lipolytica]GGF71114.1 hypothetical protein GCM10011338_24110 [Alteromonas lipolytica]
MQLRLTKVVIFLLCTYSVMCSFCSVAENDNAESKHKKVIAVASVELGNPSARLVYKPEAVRDVITHSLYRQQQFKIIDWARLSEVLFRRNMEWSDVTDNDEARGAIQEILLNDYFLTGTVSHFSERVDYDGGAFSKKKTQIANIQLDLFIKDAFTNEVVAAARGQSEKSHEVKQSLGFGAGAGANSALAQEVLNEAVDNALESLVGQLQ